MYDDMPRYINTFMSLEYFSGTKPRMTTNPCPVCIWSASTVRTGPKVGKGNVSLETSSNGSPRAIERQLMTQRPSPVSRPFLNMCGIKILPHDRQLYAGSGLHHLYSRDSGIEEH